MCIVVLFSKLFSYEEGVNKKKLLVADTDKKYLFCFFIIFSTCILDSDLKRTILILPKPRFLTKARICKHQAGGELLIHLLFVGPLRECVKFFFSCGLVRGGGGQQPFF